MSLENAHITLKIIAGIVVVAAVFYLALIWLALLPFRLAYRLHSGDRQAGVRLAELEGLAALALSGLALIRSRNAPMTRREWNRRRRALYSQRPDDEIPY